jgi:hypothetical protein
MSSRLGWGIFFHQLVLNDRFLGCFLKSCYLKTPTIRFDIKMATSGHAMKTTAPIGGEYPEGCIKMKNSKKSYTVINILKSITYDFFKSHRGCLNHDIEHVFTHSRTTPRKH